MDFFYDKEISIYSHEWYYDEDTGCDKEGYKKINDEPILVDMQPYSTARAKKDYGFDTECTRRMFSDIVPGIEKGNYIEYKNVFYEIKEIPWDDEYYEILLNNVKKKVEVIKSD